MNYEDEASGLGREAEFSWRLIKVGVEDKPGYFAIADLEKARSLRPNLFELESARLPASAEVNQDENAFSV